VKGRGGKPKAKILSEGEGETYHTESEKKVSFVLETGKEEVRFEGNRASQEKGMDHGGKMSKRRNLTPIQASHGRVGKDVLKNRKIWARKGKGGNSRPIDRMRGHVPKLWRGKKTSRSIKSPKGRIREKKKYVSLQGLPFPAEETAEGGRH